MKLTDTALKLLEKNLHLRNRLALELNKHHASIIRWMGRNDENGNLTTIQAVNIISEETGLAQEEIVERGDVRNGLENAKVS